MEVPLLRVRNLKLYFEANRGIFEKKRFVKAVDDISFEVQTGQTFGLVGESGCGKTTTARTIVRLLRPTEGKILFSGRNISCFSGSELKTYRQQVQYVFQDPYESLNPRQIVFDAIATPIRIHHLSKDRSDLVKQVDQLLLDVSLDPKVTRNKFPHQLSGGERQRVNIARALATNPKLILADEPVSMLDASLRSGILKLIKDLEDSRGVTFLIITHDIAVVREICDVIAVMYLGRIVELGRAHGVIDSPIHPYTKLLVKSTPKMIFSKAGLSLQLGKQAPESTISSSIELPKGCRFHPRCEYAVERCHSFEPSLIERRKAQFVACDVVSIEE